MRAQPEELTPPQELTRPHELPRPGSWSVWAPAGVTPWTVGVEEEVMLLDPSDWTLASQADAVTECADEKRHHRPAQYSGTQDSGERAVMPAHGIERQRENDRPHHRQEKARGGKRQQGNIR